MAEQLPTSDLLQRPFQTGRVGWGTQQVRRFIKLLRVPIGITTAPLACF